MTKVVSLQVENVKRLRAAYVAPGEGPVIVTGRNGAGKSSLLDALQMVIAGAKAAPKTALRVGEASGRIVAELSNGLTLTRVLTADGKSGLEVRDASGLVRSPQKILDKLYDAIAFDPLAFMRLSPREQVAKLRAVCGLDFAELDARRAEAYANRRDANRVVKSLEAKVSGEVQALALAPDVVAPSPDDTRAELDARVTRNKETAEAQDQIREHSEKIAYLEAELARAREGLAGWQARASSLGEAKPTEELTAKLAGIGESTAKAARQSQCREIVAELEAARAEAARFDNELSEIDVEKLRLAEAARVPVGGLDLTGEEVLLNGVPIEQGSAAEKLRICAEIAIAVNPEIRVLLVRDGSLLDEDSRIMLESAAERANMQLWLEVVGDGEPGQVLIVDGLSSVVDG